MKHFFWIFLKFSQRRHVDASVDSRRLATTVRLVDIHRRKLYGHTRSDRITTGMGLRVSGVLLWPKLVESCRRLMQRAIAHTKTSLGVHDGKQGCQAGQGNIRP